MKEVGTVFFWMAYIKIIKHNKNETRFHTFFDLILLIIMRFLIFIAGNL